MPTAAIDIVDSLQQGLDAFFAFIPNLIGFLVILLIGWIIARIVRTVVNKLGVDRALHQSQADQYVERISSGARPSHLIGAVAYWFIFLFALSAAIGALKIPALTNFIAQVQAFLPNIIVAVLIFVIAAALAGTVAVAVQKLMGDIPTRKVVTAVVPGLILAIGTFMMLNQLKIAQEIVTITYAALIGMLALAGALALGSEAATSPRRCSPTPTPPGSATRTRSSATCRPARTAASSRPSAPRAASAAPAAPPGLPRPPVSRAAPRLGGAPTVTNHRWRRKPSLSPCSSSRLSPRRSAASSASDEDAARQEARDGRRREPCPARRRLVRL